MNHCSYCKTPALCSIKPRCTGAGGFATRLQSDTCERCEAEDFTPVVEAYEISGQVVCEDCAEEIYDENSQFGVGA